MNLSKIFRNTISESQNHRCAFCGCKVHLGHFGININDSIASMDHVIPKSEGGTNSFENIVCACQDCNSIRGTLAADDFYDIVTMPNNEFERIRRLFFNRGKVGPKCMRQYIRIRERYQKNFVIAA